MGLIFGYWQYQKDLPDFTLDKMYDAVKHFPHIRHQVNIRQHIGHGHILTDNTPEAIYETMPVFLNQEQILFTAQGRIDNRKQLAAQLSLDINDEYADGTIMLKAYLQWGKACVHHLRGDWSFAVFEYKENELFVARDPMSYTSIYYLQDDTGFYFSSSVKSLLALPNYRKQLNEEHFVRKLTLWTDNIYSTRGTFYQNINTLPTAHSITVRNKVVSIKKYWEPLNIPIRYYKNKQDYAEEMSGLFQLAVQSRLRSSKPVASMLSGGLDSSTVSYVAADILKTQNKLLTTFSHVPQFDTALLHDKHKEKKILNETPFIKAVVNASGNIHPLLLNSADYSIIQGIKDSVSICGEPLHAACNLFWLNDIYRTVSQKGFGALLCGEGGNGSISFAGIDYLLPLSFRSLIRHPYSFVRRQIAKPLALKYFSNYLNKKSGATNSLEKYVLNVFLQPDIIEHYKIISDIQANNKKFHQYIPDVCKRKALFVDMFHLRANANAAFKQNYGFELRDPTSDVDLMEYFFSLPNEAFFDEHFNNRMLVKRMMKGQLPDEVLYAKKKGMQSADIVYRAKAQQEEITAAISTLKSSSAAGHYMDVNLLNAKWQQYIKQDYTNPYEMQRLLKGLEFAIFLQMNFD